MSMANTCQLQTDTCHLPHKELIHAKLFAAVDFQLHLKGGRVESRSETLCSENLAGQSSHIQIFLELILQAKLFYLLKSRKALKSFMVMTDQQSHQTSRNLLRKYVCLIALFLLHQNHIHTDLCFYLLEWFLRASLRCCCLQATVLILPQQKENTPIQYTTIKGIWNLERW